MSGYKRAIDDNDNSNGAFNTHALTRQRRRKSRWDEHNVPEEQQPIRIIQMEIQAISRQLFCGSLGIRANPWDRSPSPEPIYNNEGKRLNTREFRTRTKLVDKRHECIQTMLSLNPGYKPPADYTPPQLRVSQKVVIPRDEYPDINFVGLLIGPRGNTLKAMQTITGANITIRGKGSVKEGKFGRNTGQPTPGEDEPLHAVITGLTDDLVVKAVHKVNEMIRQCVEAPDTLRRMQLQELALLNGTLREGDGRRGCANCGSTARRRWRHCPHRPNNVVAANWSGVAHIAADCNEKVISRDAGNESNIDEQYVSFMAELVEESLPLKSTTTSSHIS